MNCMTKGCPNRSDAGIFVGEYCFPCWEKRKKRAKQLKEWRKKNIERVRKSARDYYAKNKEKISENSKKNRKKLTEKHREYYLKNKEKLIDYYKKYSIKNREKLNEYYRNYRKKKKLKKLLSEIKRENEMTKARKMICENAKKCKKKKQDCPHKVEHLEMAQCRIDCGRIDGGVINSHCIPVVKKARVKRGC